MQFRFTYETVDQSFFDQAQLCFSGTATAAVAAESVFRVLSDAASFPRWYPRMAETHWTSELPYGVGSTRRMRISGRFSVEQEVVAWARDRHVLFSFSRGFHPFVVAAAEEFSLRPLSNTSCDISWRFAMDLKVPLNLLMKLNQFIFAVHPLSGLIQRQVPTKLAQYAFGASV